MFKKGRVNYQISDKVLIILAHIPLTYKNRKDEVANKNLFAREFFISNSIFKNQTKNRLNELVDKQTKPQ